MNSHVLGAAFFTVFLLALVGCGEKPVLDEAATSFVEAQEAIEAGDTAKALELLDDSIAKRPDVWSYYHRAKIHSDNGDDELAKADVQAGLDLEPEHSDLLYLQKEMKKPQKARFRKAPPMASK